MIADQEQVDLLKQGADFWNAWRMKNPDKKVDLCYAPLNGFNLHKGNLCKADLRNVKLSRADLSRANLSNADLSHADLSKANLSDANLSNANFSNSNLFNAEFYCADLSFANFACASLLNANFFRSNLIRANFTDASFCSTDFIDANLKDANLNHAQLYKAKLTRADLSNADLSKANLSDAKLERVIALGTNFAEATLTGVCIQNWVIDTETNFEGVICDYIYLKDGQQERRPLNGNFSAYEFSTLLQKSLETIDLIFVDGIDWQAFFQSFQQLRSQFGEQEIGIQAIEKKDAGAFVVRLEASSEADKSVIESTAKELYKRDLQLIEASYQAQLQIQGEQLQHARQNNSQLMRIVEVMAENTGPKYDFRNSNVGSFADTNNGEQKSIQHNYAPEVKQTPAESAKEIQDLLIQLQENNTTDIQAVVEQRIKTDPTFRQRLQNALKEGGVETMKVLFAPIGIPIEMVRGWIEAEGS